MAGFTIDRPHWGFVEFIFGFFGTSTSDLPGLLIDLEFSGFSLVLSKRIFNSAVVL